MGKIYVCSDTHFNHTNIIKYCNRPFNSVEEMNKTIIDNWNSVVSDEDTVFFLGDFCLGKREDVIAFGKQLKGHKILVMGNHDRVTASAFTEAGFETIYKKPTLIKFDEYDITIQFSHAPVYDTQYQYPNIHGHIHDKLENDAKHFCACVEQISYTPIALEDIVKYFKGE